MDKEDNMKFLFLKRGGDTVRAPVVSKFMFIIFMPQSQRRAARARMPLRARSARAHNAASAASARARAARAVQIC